MEYSRPNIIPTPWAYGGTFETIPAQQVSSGRASWDTGFPLENTIPVSSGGIPANYNDFQGVLHDLSEHTCWQQTGGMYLWTSSVNYPVGAIVQGSDDKMYRALAKNGPDTVVANPVTDSSGKWTGFIHTTGNQTINGVLTVASGISGTVTNASSLGGVAASSYALDSNVVKLTGNQTISGGKTYVGSAVFSSGLSADTISAYNGAGYGTASLQSYNNLGGVYVTNNMSGSAAHMVNVQANGAGNAGLYDNTNSAWALQVNSAGNTRLEVGDVTIANGLAVSGTLSTDYTATYSIADSTSSGFVRLKNGTQICWGYILVSSSGTQVNFTSGFNMVPHVAMTMVAGGDPVSWGGSAYLEIAYNITSTGFEAHGRRITSGGAVTAATQYASYIATGTWKTTSSV